MKKSTFIIAFFCTFLALPKVQAQLNLGLGAGGSYIFDSKDPAVYIKGIYKINQLISGQLGVTKVFDGFDEYNITQFDLSPRIDWQVFNTISVNLEMGLNISIESTKFNGERDTHTSTGLGIGAGIAYILSESFTINGGLRQIFTNGGDLFGNLGVTCWFN